MASMTIPPALQLATMLVSLLVPVPVTAVPIPPPPVKVTAPAAPAVPFVQFRFTVFAPAGGDRRYHIETKASEFDTGLPVACVIATPPYVAALIAPGAWFWVRVATTIDGVPTGV
jgi:hypothetical protein